VSCSCVDCPGVRFAWQPHTAGGSLRSACPYPGSVPAMGGGRLLCDKEQPPSAASQDAAGGTSSYRCGARGARRLPLQVRGESWRESGAATAARPRLHGTHYPPIGLTLFLLRMLALAGVVPYVWRRQSSDPSPGGRLRYRSEFAYGMHSSVCESPARWHVPACAGASFGARPADPATMFTLSLDRPGLRNVNARPVVHIDIIRKWRCHATTGRRVHRGKFVRI